jgi:succinate dehydrogenase/fumarate reductase flavoprotein subunit
VTSAAGPEPERLMADIVIVGSGAAGLMAVRHAHRADPGLRVVLVSKGLAGRSGCSVMAQGYNAALGADDGPRAHFEDIVRGGAFLSDQSLAWTLALEAPDVIRELTDELGCAFDRTAGGAIELVPFPGNSRNRKVHRSHLTGLEILSRLRDDLLRSRPLVLEDTRALDLVVGDAGVAGLVALDVRTGTSLAIEAPVVVLAAGGSAAASYRVATPAREKSGDGLAMALRAGLPLRDMEMVQFLSVGLAAGTSKLTGALLEEALRFAGAELRNAEGERFMSRHDPERGERAPRDVVARAAWVEIADGRGTPDGGVLLDCRQVPADALRGRFRDVLDRALLAGVDLTSKPGSSV